MVLIFAAELENCTLLVCMTATYFVLQKWILRIPSSGFLSAVFISLAILKRVCTTNILLHENNNLLHI